jgi:hypothetical protein
MQPTRIRMLLAVAVLAAAVGWGVVQVVTGQSGRLVPVPWLAAAAVWLVAAATLAWAISARPRLHGRPGARPMPPIVAARTAALAMAGSRAGAAVAGLYLGILIGMLPSAGTPTGQATVWSAAGAAVGAVALIAASLWLEHLCRLPIEPDERR